MKKKEKIVYKKYHYLIILFLTALSAAMMYPMIWTILTSFKSNAEIRINLTKFFPEEWTIEGYISAFEKAPIGQWLLNSLFITFCVTAAVILTSTLMGYVFAKYEFKAKKPLFILLLATMMVPPQVTMIPRYLMIQKLGLFNTVWALIVPGLVTGFSVYLARQFISDVPDSICEAAKIDGCGEVRTLFQVIMPLIKPALATVGLFIALAYWNDWYNAMLYIKSDTKYPLQYFLYQQVNNIEAYKRLLASNLVSADVVSSMSLPTQTLKMALTIVVTGPIILAFPFVQRYFVQGITIGAVKG